jgi:hypothetical protein
MGVDMLVGNQEEATFIHDWYHEAPYGRQGAPEGWKYLNSGSFRAAYLAPSGAVYKVQKDVGPYCGYQTNEGEYEKWRSLYFGCKMPKYSRLPKLGYFPIEEGVGVIAIERFSKPYRYYEEFTDERGVSRYWSDVVSEIANKCKVGDLAGNNLFLDDDEKTIVPVDLADTW